MNQQITVQEAINTLFELISNLNLELNNVKLKNAILMRFINKKLDLTEEEIKEALKEEFDIFNKVIGSKEEIDQEFINQFTKQTFKWLTGDIEEFKEQIEEVKKDVNSNTIEIASPQLLEQLKKSKLKR